MDSYELAEKISEEVFGGREEFVGTLDSLGYTSTQGDNLNSSQQEKILRLAHVAAIIPKASLEILKIMDKNYSSLRNRSQKENDIDSGAIKRLHGRLTNYPTQLNMKIVEDLVEECFFPNQDFSLAGRTTGLVPRQVAKMH